MSLTDELLKAYEHQIEQLVLVPSSGGVFEVWLDEDLLYSKKATQRHAYAGEIRQLVEARIGPPAPPPD
ncbi:MAG: Rdx family protein [Anaerolineales bacterium]|nr:Rdx family protein [Anaerolineales bacterium]